MMKSRFKNFEWFLTWCFRAHDSASAFLGKHLFAVKRSMLILAHLSLFGFFFPEARKEFGALSADILIGILFLSPLSKIFRMRLLMQLMGIRRELGILMAYLATVHGLGYLLDPEWFSVFIGPYVWTDFFAIEPRLILGLGAYLLTLPLLLTSNTLALRFLGGKHWKQLHRLVYGAFVLAIFHRFFTRSESWLDVWGLIQVGALIGAYVFVRALAWKNFIPAFRECNAYVGARYAEYALRQKTGNTEMAQ